MMKGKIMTIISNFGCRIASLAFIVAATISAPLAAQDTLVEGKIIPKDRAEERVGFADLDLRDYSGQQVLISRVKQAARNVCRVVLRDETPEAKAYSVCPRTSFKNAKPQIEKAIANAQDGRSVAMNFVVSAGR
jgi:UrcA family protein